MSIQISTLLAFCLVIEQGSFSRAAQQLSISQPAVSQQVRTLEREYGSQLLNRGGTSVRPTQEGEIVYKYASEIVSLYKRSRFALEELVGGVARGHLTLGASTALGSYLLPHSLTRFKTQHPNVRLTMHVGDSSEILDRVVSHRLDIGFVGATRRDRHLQFEPFVCDRMVLVVSSQHKLARSEKISPQTLLEVPLILQQPGSGATWSLRAALQSHGLELGKLNVVMEAGLQESTKAAVNAGLGGTIISRLGVLEELRQGSLVELEVEGVDLEQEFWVVRHCDWPLPRLARIFLEESRRLLDGF